MALIRFGNRYPVSPDLIGPWDALLAFLEALPEESRPKGIQGMMRSVTVARQQAVNLNNMLTQTQDKTQETLTDILDLQARIAVLEDAAANPSVITHLIDEEPEGTKDGANAQFTLSRAPLWLILTLNGVVLSPEGEDYTLAGNVILYVSGKIPASTDAHHAWGLA